MSIELHPVERDGELVCPRCLKRLKPGSIHTCSPTPFVAQLENKIRELELVLAALVPLIRVSSRFIRSKRRTRLRLLSMSTCGAFHMDLYHCPKCDMTHISPTPTCPHCGHTPKPKKQAK